MTMAESRVTDVNGCSIIGEQDETPTPVWHLYEGETPRMTGNVLREAAT